MPARNTSIWYENIIFGMIHKPLENNQLTIRFQVILMSNNNKSIPSGKHYKTIPIHHSCAQIYVIKSNQQKGIRNISKIQIIYIINPEP